jgi:hypothetical protein
MNYSRKPLAFTLAFLLILSACSTSQTITNLQIALDAISAGLPILSGLTGVPPATVTQVETYLTATNQALGQASTILAGPGTDAQKAAQITAAFASIAQPVVPAQYAAIVALVATVAGDVANFLGSVPGSTSSMQLAARSASASGHTTTWSKTDYEALAHCTSTYNMNAMKLQQLKGR